MREVVLHLIEQHGARRIAFVRGPLANSEAEKRLSAYRAPLAQHGIEFDARLVVTGDFMISALRQELVPLLRADAARLDKAEELFHLGRLTISSTVQRLMVRQRLSLGHGIRTMTAVCNRLSAAFEPTELEEQIIGRLPSIGFQCCMLVLYEGRPEAESARLRVGYDRRSGQTWSGGSVTFDPKQLLPPDVVHSDGPGRSFVVLPLRYERQLFGHIMLDLNLEHAFAYGPLAEAVTTAVRGARALAHGMPESGQRAVGNPVAALAEELQRSPRTQG